MSNWTPSTPLGRLVSLAGFSYDPGQDILYSRMDALQRHFGYAYAFDAAALPTMATNIHCEPFFFEHGGKQWMIELWKGQYGLETGCEIGVYNRPDDPPAYYRILDEAIGTRPVDPDPTHGRFFQCASDSELLVMQSTLRRKGEVVFSRGPERHWWLTGFKWGIFSDPSDLVMDAVIDFGDTDMAAAFTQSARAMGYEPIQSRTTVSLEFDTPRANQPPKPEPLLATVAAEDRAIVALYDALDLPDNDPNHVPDHAVNQLAGAVLGRGASHLGTMVVEALKDVGHGVEAVVDVLARELGCAAAEVAGWLTEAGYTLESWVESVYALLHETFTLNFSTAVEVVNTSGSSEPAPLLSLVNAPVTHGTWVIQPPRMIAPGDTARFYVKDNFGLEGSAAAATYSGVGSGGEALTVTFSFGCPTRTSWPPWANTDNFATVAPAGTYRVHARSGEAGQWQDSVPRSGYPLNVAYVGGGGPPI